MIKGVEDKVATAIQGREKKGKCQADISFNHVQTFFSITGRSHAFSSHLSTEAARIRVVERTIFVAAVGGEDASLSKRRPLMVASSGASANGVTLGRTVHKVRSIWLQIMIHS